MLQFEPSKRCSLQYAHRNARQISLAAAVNPPPALAPAPASEALAQEGRDGEEVDVATGGNDAGTRGSSTRPRVSTSGTRPRSPCCHGADIDLKDDAIGEVISYLALGLVLCAHVAVG